MPTCGVHSAQGSIRRAPKGGQQMGESGFCKNLRFSAVSCENLRFPAVFCANLRLPNPLIYRASRKSAKICKNLRKCAFWVRFLPFAVWRAQGSMELQLRVFYNLKHLWTWWATQRKRQSRDCQLPYVLAGIAANRGDILAIQTASGRQ